MIIVRMSIVIDYNIKKQLEFPVGNIRYIEAKLLDVQWLLLRRVRTLRHQDTSAPVSLRHFGTGAELSVRHFGTGAEVSETPI